MTLNELFSQKSKDILNVYFTAGHPKKDDTANIILSLQSAGVDMLEIGAPYSDPLADGATIQESSSQALKNGISLELIFEQVKAIKSKITMPLVLMGYYNQFLQYGIEKLLNQMLDSGIEGLIIPDLPEDYYIEHYKEKFENKNIKISFLITPETDENRIKLLDELSAAFLYIVAQSGTTGSSGALSKGQKAYFERIKNMSLKSPTLIGFGIHDKTSFDNACLYAKGAIIGSAFIRMLTNDGVSGITNFIKKIKGQ